MGDNSKFKDELQRFQQIEGKDESVSKKLDELLALLKESEIDSENIKAIRGRVNQVLDDKLEAQNAIKDVKDLASSEMDKLEQLDQLEILLNKSRFDSGQVRQPRFKILAYKGIKILIGLLFVTLGFAMIIMPAPPYFEMFTIFYFNPDDGVTLMDLISLIIVATGIFIILNAVLKMKPDE
ncbi:hypothetical protein [Pedobacter deserti]|uniref:hypothetical protein n=1 Tax=Pedobacter deserti TaxID=2817382 RepID=UPI002108FCFF|nr:hypothetical protein [Pedobacter sp. SYSU D00382]